VGVAPSLRSLAETLLQRDPKRRPSALEALEHLYLRDDAEARSARELEAYEAREALGVRERGERAARLEERVSRMPRDGARAPGDGYVGVPPSVGAGADSSRALAYSGKDDAMLYGGKDDAMLYGGKELSVHHHKLDDQPVYARDVPIGSGATAGPTAGNAASISGGSSARPRPTASALPPRHFSASSQGLAKQFEPYDVTKSTNVGGGYVDHSARRTAERSARSGGTHSAPPSPPRSPPRSPPLDAPRTQ